MQDFRNFFRYRECLQNRESFFSDPLETWEEYWQTLQELIEVGQILSHSGKKYQQDYIQDVVPGEGEEIDHHWFGRSCAIAATGINTFESNMVMKTHKRLYSPVLEEIFVEISRIVCSLKEWTKHQLKEGALMPILEKMQTISTTSSCPKKRLGRELEEEEDPETIDFQFSLSSENEPEEWLAKRHLIYGNVLQGLQKIGVRLREEGKKFLKDNILGSYVSKPRRVQIRSQFPNYFVNIDLSSFSSRKDVNKKRKYCTLQKQRS
jgi:hypothetical protein